ncbi:MAG: hypothetical protein ACLFTI_04310 [Anaerolineales bacterium]
MPAFTAWEQQRRLRAGTKLFGREAELGAPHDMAAETRAYPAQIAEAVLVAKLTIILLMPKNPSEL